MKNSFAFLMLLTSSLFAHEADVLKVEHNCDKQMMCSFDVTIKHADTGWEHYADKFDVLLSSKKVIATRTLFHPHVNEQPFTRSLSNVKIPTGVDFVIIRAHDLVHGYGGKEITVNLK